MADAESWHGKQDCTFYVPREALAESALTLKVNSITSDDNEIRDLDTSGDRCRNEQEGP